MSTDPLLFLNGLQRCASMRTDCKRPILRFAFSALMFAANKTIEKHISFFNRCATHCELIVREVHKTLLNLTPNVASEGRRSAQHAGVPSTGWLGGRLGQLGFAFSSMCFRWPSRISSTLLYDLSNPTTRSYGLPMPTDLSDSGAPLT